MIFADDNLDLEPATCAFGLDGPDMPDELLTARDEGRVVFFCCAGVSRAQAELPILRHTLGTADAMNKPHASDGQYRALVFDMDPLPAVPEGRLHCQ